MMDIRKEEKNLYEVILVLKTPEEFYNFFNDLCTPSELKAMEERWHVAQLLNTTSLSYRQIHEKTGVSIATITRVARFLQHERYNGYKLLLNHFKERLAKGEEIKICDAILALKTVEDCYIFFSDICTPSEVKSMRERWVVAVLLYSTTMSYRQIHEQTMVSIATITRVARFLQHEKNNGYKIAMQKLDISSAKEEAA